MMAVLMTHEYADITVGVPEARLRHTPMAAR
jgi:hypothetical protein